MLVIVQLQQWNKDNYKGLIPQFDGGPKAKLDYKEQDNVIEEISGKGMTIKDTIKYVNTKHETDYTYSGGWRILRKVKNVPYGKPYIQNEKKTRRCRGYFKKKLALFFTFDPIWFGRFWVP